MGDSYCTVYFTGGVQIVPLRLYCTGSICIRIPSFVYCTVHVVTAIQCILFILYFTSPRVSLPRPSFRSSPRLISPCPACPARYSSSVSPPSSAFTLYRPFPPALPLTPLVPAPPPPRPLLPCCQSCMRYLRSSSSARSRSTIRVSCFSLLQGKNLHFGLMKRQFPKCGRKSRQTVCVRTALSAVRSISLAPSPPFSTSSHALSTISSCACAQQGLVILGGLPPLPNSTPQGPFELLRASGFIRAVCAQPLAVLTVRPRAQFTPTRLLIQDESPSHRVVSA
eukprot:5308859-Pleurochrysis_carterae.AAC.4